MKDKIDICIKGHSISISRFAIVISVITTLIMAVLGTFLSGVFGTISGTIIGLVISIILIFLLPPKIKESDTEITILGNSSDDESEIKDNVEVKRKDSNL
jgi:hypothetical protein